MGLELKNIIGMKFRYLLIKHSIANDNYMVLCCKTRKENNADVQDNVVVNDTSGLVKGFKSIDSAMNAADKIIQNNIVQEVCVRVEPSQESIKYSHSIIDKRLGVDSVFKFEALREG